MTHVTEHPLDGTPTWINLMVPDVERAKEFYGGLFGWTFAAGPAETSQTLCLLDGRTAAGLMEHIAPEVTALTWYVYLATAQLEQTLQRAVAAGAEVINDPIELPGQGTFAIVRDPGGAIIGLWQGEAGIGCTVVNEPGALVRSDLVTPDPLYAKDFYPAIFDYTTDTYDGVPGLDFTYLLRADGHRIGGILGDAAAEHSEWVVCFDVVDLEAASQHVIELGGRVARADISYLYGDFAVVHDPFGTKFALVQRPVAGD